MIQSALSALFLCLAAIPALSQVSGELDLSFDPGSGVNGPVQSIVLQPDGQILIGGEFTTVVDAVRRGIARLNPDGSADRGFEARLSPGFWGLAAMIVQPDGKVLVAGRFSSSNAPTRFSVERLNPDGSLDTTFDAGVGADQEIIGLALQPDNKVLIVGAFTQMSGTNRNRVARLHADGSLDLNFDPGMIEGIPGRTGSAVNTVAVQSDGRIVIGGSFYQVQGESEMSRSVARLEPDGSLDRTFRVRLRSDSWTSWLANVKSVVVHPDGKLLVAGSFILEQESATRRTLARLNADGTLDSTFEAQGDPENVLAVSLSSDGNLWLAAQFRTNNVTTSAQLVRLRPDGRLDPGFHSLAKGVSCLAVPADGQVLIGGAFPDASGLIRNLARLTANGTPDHRFNPGSGVNHFVHAVAVQPDEKVLIGGEFTMIQGVARSGLARLQGDGSLDPSFNPGTIDARHQTGFRPWVNSVVLQPDGRVLIGGAFTHIAAPSEPGGSPGQVRHCLARLQSDGALDALFVPALSAGADPPLVTALALHPDGRVLVGQTRMVIEGGCRCSGIVRLNGDGSLDPAFQFADADGAIDSILVQENGEMLIQGTFRRIRGASRMGLARLHADGTLDDGFNPAVDDLIESVALQADQKVLIGGWFTAVNGSPRRHVARLDADGSLDSMFDPGQALPGIPRKMIATPPDGVVATFTDVNGTMDCLLLRLNTDGTLDRQFNAQATGAVRSLALQPDGKLLLGGEFSGVNGIARWHAARVHLQPSVEAIRLINATASADGCFAFVLSPESGRACTVQASPDLITWFDVEVVRPADGSYNVRDETLARFPQRFFRVKSD